MSDPLKAGQFEANWLADWRTVWNRFWFTPTTAETLGLMRILVGLMVLYSHSVWTFEFDAFVGGEMLPTEYRQLLFETEWEAASCWSHFDWMPAGWRLPVHFLGLAVVVGFILGWQTRVMAAATALLVISYANRTLGALFGLDQILAYLTFYLAIGNCGDAFSVDRWRSRSNQQALPRGLDLPASPLNTIAVRLMQIHLCVVYLFAGLGKCQGNNWWNGEAIWGAFASYEYQTVDMTWVADQMWLVAVLTMLTLVWEIGYSALVWHRLTRPIVLGMAIPMHLGIGICMGMMTFGMIMLVANLAFVRPETIRKIAWPPQT